MLQRFVACFLLLCGHITCYASGYVYIYTPSCNRAYQHFMSLHMAEGRSAVLKEALANPYNLMSTYVADYEDCLLLLLNCDKSEYDQRREHFDSRLQMLEKGDVSSPWYRYCKAGLYLHWAIVHTRFGDHYRAALKFRKSYVLLRENQRLFPRFEYNNVFIGLQESVIGSLPGNYRWLASVFGIKGDLKRGTGMLEQFLRTHKPEDPVYTETVLYNVYTRFYLMAQHAEVWNFLNSSAFSSQRNLLNSFVQTNIALDYRKAEAAKTLLTEASSDTCFDRYPIFAMQMGLALMARSDVNATLWFQKYINSTKSDLAIKESWQKCAWVWYLAGNMRQAEFCRRQIVNNGGDRTDADRQAQRFGEGGNWPVKEVLRARLLIDGGYADDALGVLTKVQPASLAVADRAEYYFRLGRAYEETADTRRALESYLYAVREGRERHEQFAARAALHMGQIYERAGMKAEALGRFHQCLNMPAHDFQNSIDQQAKAGINRLE